MKSANSGVYVGLVMHMNRLTYYDRTLTAIGIQMKKRFQNFLPGWFPTPLSLFSSLQDVELQLGD